MLQAAEGHADEIERRISRGQSVDVKHAVRATVLLCSTILSVSISLTPFLLQRLKYAAMHAAADHGHLEVIKVLIRYGASINIRRTVSVHLQAGTVQCYPTPDLVVPLCEFPLVLGRHTTALCCSQWADRDCQVLAGEWC